MLWAARSRCSRRLQPRSSNQAPERRITFRVGIHWEPVIFDLNDVYGGGVDIAVRLQSAAPAGGVVVSSALLEQAGDLHAADLGDLRIDDLGELHLKNLVRPIRAFSVRLPGVSREGVFGVSAKMTRWARLPSIAVLPFSNLSSDADDNYFAEGLVEDIILTLSNIPELLVVARGSGLAFQKRALDPLQVSEKLGARYFLTGTIRRSDKHLRLSVELVDVATSSVIWAEKYNVLLDELFATQDEIATQIVGKISNHVRRQEVTRALRKSPQSLNAYDYLLRALDHLYQLDFANFARAKTLLERACEEDDSYGAPYSFLADWHMFNIQEGWSSDPQAEALEVIRLTNCAIERDPANALALAIQGHARSIFFREYDAAVDLFDRALAISPNSALAWMSSSATYGFIGEAQSGIARAERAIRLSPLDQQSFISYSRLGQNHYLNGTYEEAIRWSRKALSFNPQYGTAARIAAAGLVAVGRADEARGIAAYHTKILPRFTVSNYAPRCPFKEPQASLYVERLRAAGILE